MSTAQLEEHIAAMVASWPAPTPDIVRRVTTILRGDSLGPVHIPDSPNVIAARKAREALEKARREFKEALDGCHGCGLSPKVHDYQKGHAGGYHNFQELSPDGAIKVAQVYKKKIMLAERALEKAEQA